MSSLADFRVMKQTHTSGIKLPFSTVPLYPVSVDDVTVLRDH